MKMQELKEAREKAEADATQLRKEKAALKSEAQSGEQSFFAEEVEALRREKEQKSQEKGALAAALGEMKKRYKEQKKEAKASKKQIADVMAAAREKMQALKDAA